MTREEAIERLKQNKAAAEFYAGMVQNTNAIENELKDIEAMDMAIEALSAAEPKAGWIPVSERLPEEYAQYLVCFKTGHCYVYWLEDSDWARGMAEKEGIIAWMPLPEPYRDGGEE